MAKDLICLCNPRRRALKILDIGCGTGAFMDELTAAGHEAWGVDISEEAARFCRMRGHRRLYLADAANVPFTDRTVDLVTAIGVIEHLENDEMFLREVARILKPQGCFIMLTSSFPWLWSMHDVANEHKRRYYLKDIEEKITASHFQTVRLSHLNCFVFPLLATVLVFHRFFYGIDAERSHRILPIPPTPVKSMLTKVLSLETALMRRIRLPWGVSMIGAFRRTCSGTH